MYILFFALISSYGIAKIIEIDRDYIKLKSNIGCSFHVPQTKRVVFLF